MLVCAGVLREIHRWDQHTSLDSDWQQDPGSRVFRWAQTQRLSSAAPSDNQWRRDYNMIHSHTHIRRSVYSKSLSSLSLTCRNSRGRKTLIVIIIKNIIHFVIFIVVVFMFLHLMRTQVLSWVLVSWLDVLLLNVSTGLIPVWLCSHLLELQIVCRDKQPTPTPEHSTESSHFSISPVMSSCLSLVISLWVCDA